MTTMNHTTTKVTTTSATKQPYLIIGILAILMPLAFGICYGILAAVFGYPGIGDEPGNVVLTAFNENSTIIGAAFYVIAMTELLRIVIAVGLHQMLNSDRTRYLAVFTVIGILAGLVRMLDYILWPFLVPRLVELSTDSANADVAAGLFRVLFSYLGDALGGNLGILFLFVWIWGIALAIWQHGLFPRWVAVFGFFGGLLVMINYLEFLGSTTGFIGILGTLGQVVQNVFFLTLGIFIVIKGHDLAYSVQKDS